MAITDDDVKTRGQKEKLEEISAPAQEESGNADAATGGEEPEKEEEKEPCPPPPKVPRDGTMVVTAKVIMTHPLNSGRKLAEVSNHLTHS